MRKSLNYLLKMEQFHLQISNELRETLESFSDDSKYAKMILSPGGIEGDLLPDPVNYLSISSEDPSKISYLTQERILKTDPQDLWGSSRRYHARPAVVLSKIFKSVEYFETEKFTNHLKTYNAKKLGTFSIVKGDEILPWYHQSNYETRSNGSLNTSCMKHEFCQEYFDIYVQNPEIVSMLVFVDKTTGKLLGRSLLWTLPDTKIMDRIYTINDSVFPQLFKEFAKDGGYLYKAYQNWNSTMWFMQNGQKVQLEFSAKLDIEDIKFFPYLDTFKFLDIKTGLISNYLDEISQNLKTLTSTHGSYHDARYLTLNPSNGNYYLTEDMHTLSYREGLFHQSDLVWSDSCECYIHQDNALWNDDEQEWYFNEEFDHLNH